MEEQNGPREGFGARFDPGAFTDNHTRRALLKAAIVGSAAVATVGGASTAALALSGKRPANLLVVSSDATPTPSPNDPCAVCTTGTNPADFVDEDTFGNNSLFLWVRFINVPAGSYSIDVTPMIEPQNTACVAGHPLDYQSDKNNVTSWIFPAGGLACHPHALTDWAGGTQSDTLPASFTTSALQDLAVQVHLNPAGCTGTFTITGTLTNTTTKTVVMQCTHMITLT
jgi:hypothetical protein